MSKGEKKNEQRSLDELIAILGQPVKEWISKSQSEPVLEGVNAATALKLGAPEEGAFEVLKWQCTPVPSDAAEIANEWAAIRAEALPNTRLIARAREALEAMSDCCKAASRISNGKTHHWVMIRVCSRHASTGLVEDHTWGAGF